MINIILEDSNIKNGGQCPSKIQKTLAPKTLPAIGVGMIQQHQLWSNIIIFRVMDCSIGFRNTKDSASATSKKQPSSTAPQGLDDLVRDTIDFATNDKKAGDQ